MNVRHATLLNVYGRPAKFGNVTIVPAQVELEGRSFRSSFPLAVVPASRIPAVLKRPIANQYDVAWVRARLPHAFGVWPEQSEIEKTLLCEGFVAVIQGQDETEGPIEAIAFWCSDHYGKTSLIFSDAEQDEVAKAAAADAFWSVLLSEPEMLEDFEATVRHLGAGVNLHFGCDNGQPFCHESAD